MKTKSTKNMGNNAADRPSLYSFNSRERDSAEISSILDALEPRHRKSAIWWRSIVVGLVVMLAAALYLIGRDVDVYRQLSPVARSETIVKRETREPLPAVAASVDESSAAALIVEAPLHPDELQAPESPGTGKPQESTAATATDPIHAAGAETEKVARVVTGAEPKNMSPSAGSGQLPATEQATTPARKKESSAMPRAQAGTKVVARATPAKDSDVDLIAALVSHVSRGDNSGKESRKKSAKATADTRAAAASARKDRRIDPGHDIVVRNDGDSTETLVKRCRALGLIEGELCRVRICSGRWGTDPACPGAVTSDQLSTSGR